MSLLQDSNILSVKSLRIDYFRGNKVVNAVDKVSLDVKKGEVLAIIGESGSGKSTVARAIAGLLPLNARVVSGSILFENEDILKADQRKLREIRGKKIGFIFQEPVSYLNPVLKVGEQISETLIYHTGVDKDKASKEAKNLLRYVSVPDADRVYNYYPHQLSGGMAQRVCIAMAISCRPSLLIADEPTSNLDLTVQAQILNLLDRLRREFSMSIVLISHDLGVVSGISDRIVVMYAGRVAEESTTERIIKEPKHPYTKLLLAVSISSDERIYGSIPDLSNPPPGCRFSPRCPFSFERCGSDPEEFFVKGSRVYCWLYEGKEWH